MAKPLVLRLECILGSFELSQLAFKTAQLFESLRFFGAGLMICACSYSPRMRAKILLCWRGRPQTPLYFVVLPSLSWDPRLRGALPGSDAILVPCAAVLPPLHGHEGPCKMLVTFRGFARGPPTCEARSLLTAHGSIAVLSDMR